MEMILRAFKGTLTVILWLLIIGLIAGDVTWSHYNEWWLFSTTPGRILALMLGIALLYTVIDNDN